MVKAILVIEINKISFSIVLIFQILIWFINLKKNLDLNLGKLRLFDLVETTTILFSIFLTFLYLLQITRFCPAVSTNSSKYSANFIKIILWIKVNSLAILLKF